MQVPNNYETDLIYPIIEKASKLANVSYDLADDNTKMNLKVSYLFRNCKIF
jgi:alanyl-tRNA synthetase